MNYYTVQELADIWHITQRRIIKLCNEGRIEGAIKNGKNWAIPTTAIKPLDKRSKSSNYIDIQKKAMVINIDNELGVQLLPRLLENGLIVSATATKKDFSLENCNIYNMNLTDKTDFNIQDLEYLIIIDLNQKTNIKLLLDLFQNKMGSTASVTIITNNNDDEIDKDIVNELWTNRGIRINKLNIQGLLNKSNDINYENIINDILNISLKFKNTTGLVINNIGNVIEFNKNSKSQKFSMGEYYHILKYYIDTLKENNTRWAISPMRYDEWNTDPLEIDFKIWCIDAANKGSNIEMYYMFSKDKIKEYKNNKTIRLYINSNINTFYIDYDLVKLNDPELLTIIDNGIAGVDDKYVILDLPENGLFRGFISKNKDDINKYYNCYLKIKKYAVPLKSIL